MSKGVFGKWVARATRLLRLATRRPELRIATSRKGHPHWLEPLLPLRPASRRTAQAGRLCYQKRFFKHPLIPNDQRSANSRNPNGPPAAAWPFFGIRILSFLWHWEFGLAHF